MSDSNSRLEQLLELERLEYIGIIEVERKHLEENVRHIRAVNAQAGLLESGSTNLKVAKAGCEYREKLLRARLELRRKYAREEPTLLSDENLKALEKQIERSIAVSAQAEKDEGDRRDHAAGRQLPRRSDFRIEGEGHELLALARREIAMMKLQSGLGLVQSRAAAADKPTMVINIQSNTITSLNLGTVLGDMVTSIGSLEHSGHEQLAQAITRLTEAIARDESLGPERREMIESLSTIAEQATVPAEKRKLGVVKTLLNGLGASLRLGADTAKIWDVVGPQISGYFGV